MELSFCLLARKRPFLFITRKAYGGANKHLRSDFNIAALPGAEVAFMGSKGTAEVVFRGKDIVKKCTRVQKVVLG